MLHAYLIGHVLHAYLISCVSVLLGLWQLLLGFLPLSLLPGRGGGGGGGGIVVVVSQGGQLAGGDILCPSFSLLLFLTIAITVTLVLQLFTNTKLTQSYTPQ